MDRLTYQQYPRGHVDDLKVQVQALEEENAGLKAQISFLQQSQKELLAAPTDDAPALQASACGGDLAADIGLLSLEGTSERKYIGASSGVYFGKLVGTILPRQAESLPLEAQLTNPLRFGLGRRAEQKPTDALQLSPPERFMIPNVETANLLQEAFFSHRWPSLPFLHRPTFIKNTMNPC